MKKKLAFLSLALSTSVFVNSKVFANEFEPIHPQVDKSLISGCQKVWTGTVARTRIYNQPNTTGNKVYAYIGSGSNNDYIGWTDNTDMIKVLFKTINSSKLTGYTNSSCKIEWIDYKG